MQTRPPPSKGFCAYIFFAYVSDDHKKNEIVEKSINVDKFFLGNLFFLKSSIAYAKKINQNRKKKIFTCLHFFLN